MCRVCDCLNSKIVKKNLVSEGLSELRFPVLDEECMRIDINIQTL